MERPPGLKPRSHWLWVATTLMIVGFVPLFLTGPCTAFFGIPMLFADLKTLFGAHDTVDKSSASLVGAWAEISLTGLVILLAGYWLHRRLDR